jgi:hypothetical protein
MTSITNGWNAVCALDETQVNALLQQQYLKYAGGGSQGGPLTFGIMGKGESPGDAYGAVMNLAAPQISLLNLSGGQTATASAQVDSAVVVWNMGAMWFSPQCLMVQRNISLQRLAGTVGNSIGSVALTFPSSGTQPVYATIYDGLTDYLANGLATFTLGDITNTNPGPGLEPATFEFAIQTSGNSSALLLFITTVGGQPGNSLSLTEYPLQTGVTAALVISEDIFWSQVLTGAMETALNASAANAGYAPFSQITFSAQQDASGSWSITSTGGIANLGYLTLGQTENDYPFALSVNALPLPIGSNFQVSIAADGSVEQSCSVTISDSAWEQDIPGQNPSPIGQTGNVTLAFSYTCNGEVALDPATDLVTLGNSRTTSLQPVSGASFVTQIWNAGPLTQSNSQFANTHSPYSTETFLPYASAPSVNAFALANLLFPNEIQLTLNAVSLPGDLLLTGALAQVFSIQPQTVTLAPGANLQFAASAADVRWSCDGGSIDNMTGAFSAPTANAAQTIQITAMNMANDAVTHAIVTIVIPNTGFVVSPTTALMMMSIPIFATDTLGSPVEVNCSCTYSNVTLSRQAAGYWTCALKTFPNFGDTFTVTVTSASDPSLTATVDVTLAAVDPVTVDYDASSGIASAISAAGNTEFYWAISPASAGTAVPVPGNSSQATITIPTPPDVYAICAYYANIETGQYGFGTSWLSVSGGGPIS